MSVCRKDFSVNVMMKGSLARIFSYSNIHHLRESSRFTFHRSRIYCSKPVHITQNIVSLYMCSVQRNSKILFLRIRTRMSIKQPEDMRSSSLDLPLKAISSSVLASDWSAGRGCVSATNHTGTRDIV